MKLKGHSFHDRYSEGQESLWGKNEIFLGKFFYIINDLEKMPFDSWMNTVMYKQVFLKVKEYTLTQIVSS